MPRRAVVLATPRGPVSVETAPLPEPGPGDALVRMEACGVCHSELFVADLEKLPLAPLILGHEGIGRVTAVGPDAGPVRVGDRVGITFLAWTCGACEPCRTGRERYCARQKNAGYTLHGALTTEAVVPVQHLVRVPDALEASLAAPLCCAGWTAYGALRTAALEPGQFVAVFGMGGLGHLAVQYARHLGLRAAAADVSPEKLAHARELGAEIALPAETASRTLQKEHGGVDAAIVLTGNPVAVEQAFRSVKRTGTVVLVGLSSSQYQLPLVDTVLKGICVRGSYLGTRADLEAAFRLAADGVVRPEVSAHALDQAPAVLNRLRHGNIQGRAVIVF